jgi:hypothetical protein
MSAGIRLILRNLSLGLLCIVAFLPLAASPQRKSTGPRASVHHSPAAAVTNATLRSESAVPALPCAQQAQAAVSGSPTRIFKRRIFLESTSEPGNEALQATRIDVPPASCPAPPLELAALRTSVSSDANRQRAP